MTTSVRVSVIGVLAAACLLPRPAEAVAAAVLRSADIRIHVTSPTACEVTMALAIDGGSEVEHRIEAFPGSRLDLIAIRDAQQVGAPHAIGRTRSLVLRLDGSAYEIRYRALQPEDRAHRCPLWLPTVPTDGRSRSVRLHVELPPATTPWSSVPTFAWTGTSGTTLLGHVPAFVRVPHARDGDAPGWDIALVMDVTTVAVFLVASALWVWRRKR